MPSINVTELESSETRVVRVETPDDVPSGKLIHVLANKMHLPGTVRYSFYHKNSGRMIRHDVTLAAARVENGDILRLPPQICA